jgi:NADH dehydrogenase
MRVAVFGGGYAGLTLASKLQRSLPDADLVVVDADGRHLVQHELHRVIRFPDLAAEITVDLQEVLGEATVHTATVSTVDAESGVAGLADGRQIEYDVGAVCLGAETAFDTLQGVREHATPLKRLSHAREIRQAFLAAVERGTPADPARVVVGGAGLSGVQVAGELAALAGERDGREAVDIVILEQEASVAPAFPANFQRAVRAALTDRGVTVRTGTAVAGASEATIELANGETLGYDQLVWTGGIRGPAALDGQRPVTRKDLRLTNGTFVLGDAARVVDTDGAAVPASAQAAVRQAWVAADNIERLVAHRQSGGGGFDPRLEGYRFDSPGWLVSVGDGAVAQVGPAVFTGPAARALKTTVGAGYLSSVGAIENAVELVREELGWPAGDNPPVDGADEATDEC